MQFRGKLGGIRRAILKMRTFPKILLICLMSKKNILWSVYYQKTVKKHYHFDLTLTTQLCSDQSQLSQGYLSKPRSYKLITVVCSLLFLVTKWLFPENTIFYEYLCFRTQSTGLNLFQ